MSWVARAGTVMLRHMAGLAFVHPAPVREAHPDSDRLAQELLAVAARAAALAREPE